eukprot:1075120_1
MAGSLNQAILQGYPQLDDCNSSRSDSCFGEKMQNEMKGKQIEENYQTHLSKKMTKAPTYDERDAYISNTFEQMELAVCNRGNTMGGYKFTETWDMPCTHLDDIA